MIEETVNAILKAEKEAKEMEDQAMSDAKAMVANASEEADKIRKNAVFKVKEERLKVVEQAESEGEKQADAILKIGIKTASTLAEKTNIEKAVEIIKEKVIKKYVDSKYE